MCLLFSDLCFKSDYYNKIWKIWSRNWKLNSILDKLTVLEGTPSLFLYYIIFTVISIWQFMLNVICLLYNCFVFRVFTVVDLFILLIKIYKYWSECLIAQRVFLHMKLEYCINIALSCLHCYFYAIFLLYILCNILLYRHWYLIKPFFSCSSFLFWSSNLRDMSQTGNNYEISIDFYKK